MNKQQIAQKHFGCTARTVRRWRSEGVPGGKNDEVWEALKKEARKVGVPMPSIDVGRSMLADPAGVTELFSKVFPVWRG